MVVRVFVGGLPIDVTEEDLKQRFSKISGCVVDSIDMVMAGEKGRGIRDFAYVNLKGSTQTALDAAVSQYIQIYNNSKWKGKRLRVEIALPRYKERLEEEKNEILKAQQQAVIDKSLAHSTSIKTRYSGTRIVFD